MRVVDTSASPTDQCDPAFATSIAHLTAVTGQLESEHLGVLDLGGALEQLGRPRDKGASNLAGKMGETPLVAREGIKDREVAIAEAHSVPAGRVRLLHHRGEAAAEEGLDLVGLSVLGQEPDEQRLHHRSFLLVYHRSFPSKQGEQSRAK